MCLDLCFNSGKGVLMFCDNSGKCASVSHYLAKGGLTGLSLRNSCVGALMSTLILVKVLWCLLLNSRMFPIYFFSYVAELQIGSSTCNSEREQDWIGSGFHRDWMGFFLFIYFFMFWDWDGIGFFSVGLGWDRNENRPPCHPLAHTHDAPDPTFKHQFLNLWKQKQQKKSERL